MGRAGTTGKLILLVLFLSLAACYHKEVCYSFTPSNGGVRVEGSVYYLAQAREYRLSKFPSGIAKELRQVFGLFRTDTANCTTTIAARLVDICAFESCYKSHLEHGDSFIAFGVYNVAYPDSVDGVYLFNLKRNSLTRVARVKSLPTMLPNGSLIAYFSGNRLIIDEVATRTTLLSYLLTSTPDFVSWKDAKTLLLCYPGAQAVLTLNLETGRIADTGLNTPCPRDEVNADLLGRIAKSIDARAFFK
jgi:hypothetical protein